jgi:hypothetical protein
VLISYSGGPAAEPEAPEAFISSPSLLNGKPREISQANRAFLRAQYSCVEGAATAKSTTGR